MILVQGEKKWKRKRKKDTRKSRIKIMTKLGYPNWDKTGIVAIALAAH